MPDEQPLVLGYWFRPESGCDDRIGPAIGPFPDWLQLTYDGLRVSPDGEDVAAFFSPLNVEAGAEGRTREFYTRNPKWLGEDGERYSGWHVEGSDDWWTDLVIYVIPLEPGRTLLCGDPGGADADRIAAIWADWDRTEAARKAKHADDR